MLLSVHGSDQEQLRRSCTYAVAGRCWRRKKSTGAPRLVRGLSASSNRWNPRSNRNTKIGIEDISGLLVDANLQDSTAIVTW